MKNIITFISIAICLIFTSCLSKTSDKNRNLYRSAVEVLYFYEDEHEDSLIVGLRMINKETHYWGNGESEDYLYMGIENPDYAGNPCKYNLLLDEEETSLLRAFLDSCMMSPLQSNEIWEVKMKSGVIFSCDRTDKSLYFDCNQGTLIVLQITPQRLKEILDKIKESE